MGFWRLREGVAAATLEQHTALALSSLRRAVSEARTDQSAGHAKPMGRCCHATATLVSHSYILSSRSFLSTTLVSHFLVLYTRIYLPSVSRQQLPEGGGLGQLCMFVGLCKAGGTRSCDPDSAPLSSRLWCPPVGPDSDGGVRGV